MADETPSALTQLDDTHLTLDVPADEVRGRKVVDRGGDEATVGPAGLPRWDNPG
jgi:hypothetical protein